jgi:hypothetical protein
MKNNDCFVDDNSLDKRNRSDELLAIKVQIAKANLELLNAKINKIKTNNYLKNNNLKTNKNQTVLTFD